jgi:DNA replication protein DnaC
MYHISEIGIKIREQAMQLDGATGPARSTDAEQGGLATVRAQTRADRAAPASASSPVCPHCRGIGWYLYDVSIDHPAFGTLQRCTCNRSKTRLEQQLGSYWGKTFASFKTDWTGQKQHTVTFKRALATAQTYASRPTGWLYILGPRGSGKTHLAAAIAQETDAMPLEWWMTNNLLNALRADNFANHDQLLQRVKTCDLLVLDDLGAEHKTGWAEATLFSIVYERDMHNRLLLITSNISPRQLSERTRDRIYGKSEAIQMPDVSYRSRGKEW